MHALSVSYEMNPPRIMRDSVFEPVALRNDLRKFIDRISRISYLADSIHLTDSVLGVPRVSSISIAREVLRFYPNLRLRCSVRSRDRNLSAVIQRVADAVLMGVEGLLVVKGDKPQEPATDCGRNPSELVAMLNQQGFGDKINLYLSIPSNPDFEKIRKKIEAEPFGFITQSICSISHLERIFDHAKSYGIRVVPTIMIPSEKNRESARMISLDWSQYEKDAYSFIKRASDICGEVLITSPNSFSEGVECLTRLKGAN